jgi:hypothetical protein
MTDRITGQRPPFAEWCQCTRLLLGWVAGMPGNWPDLYAAGVTPLQAARRTVFGEQALPLEYPFAAGVASQH